MVQKVLILIQRLIVAITLLLPWLSSAQNLSDGLIAHYEFNGNADDSSGNNYHGIVNATLATDRNGTPNSCYFFNGFSNYIDLPNEPLLKPELPVSLSFWVNFSSLKPSVLTTDFAQDIHTGVWVALNSEGRIAFSFGDGGSANPYSRRTFLGETVLETGKWYHILGVVRAANDIDIYINGIKECGAYSGSGGALAYSNLPGSLGRKDSNTNLPPHYFHGYIDDFYYWNRVVDISEIYQSFTTSVDTDILTFNVPEQISPTVIDTLNHTISIVVGCNSGLTLTPIFQLSENAIGYVNNTEQNSGVSVNDFEHDVVYTVTNKLKCSTFSTSWTVSITKKEISKEMINLFTSFKNIELEGQVGPAVIDTLNFSITFKVGCKVDINNLYLNFELHNGTLGYRNENAIVTGSYYDFSKPIGITLADSGFCVMKTWEIVVQQDHLTETELLENEGYFIPNIITPNQDGFNDYFKLGESLVGAKLTIVNRYGNLVYSSNDYKNEFSGANLSSGVYYYAININCYEDVIKGTLSILK